MSTFYFVIPYCIVVSAMFQLGHYKSLKGGQKQETTGSLQDTTKVISRN